MNAEIETQDVNPIAAEQRAFATAIETGTPPERNTPEQALAVQRVLDAIQRSSESGEAVSVE